jgi:hypothetical protein
MVIDNETARPCRMINCEVMRCLVGLIQMMMSAEVMSKDEYRVLPAPKTGRVTVDVMVQSSAY